MIELLPSCQTLKVWTLITTSWQALMRTYSPWRGMVPPYDSGLGTTQCTATVGYVGWRNLRNKDPLSSTTDSNIQIATTTMVNTGRPSSWIVTETIQNRSRGASTRSYRLSWIRYPGQSNSCRLLKLCECKMKGNSKGSITCILNLPLKCVSGNKVTLDELISKIEYVIFAVCMTSKINVVFCK